MPADGEVAASFQPPGPGAWTLDTDRFPRPATRFVMELFPRPARRGFEEATAEYGLLLDHIQWAFVHRWAYLSPRPVPPLAETTRQPSRQAWDQLVDSTVVLRDRLATSARAFDATRWRRDIRWWDEQVKPAIRRGHDELAAVEPTALEVHELAAHLDHCRTNLWNSIYYHHRLNVAPVIPVGDFLAHAQQWTGHPAGELLALVQERGPASPAAPELVRLADALRADTAASDRVFADDEPASVLAFLRTREGPVGRAATTYLALAGDCSLGGGSDVGEPRLVEMPQVLLETIRGALHRDAGHTRRETTAARSADVRSAVPPERRAAFDVLLAEASASHRVRDERATHCDVRAYGLARRAILAAGRRLADAGAIHEAEHLVEAGYEEMRTLLTGDAGPSGEELAARARYRREADQAQAPAVLGGPPRSPVPTEWLPAGAARTEEAFRTYLQAMSQPAHTPPGGAVVHGLGASAGTWEGRARLVHSAYELERLEQGDVLVATSTTPAFNVVLPIIGALVTDRGGLLSHAAIVAREYAIPAVVGAGEATTTIPDGALVTVDGASGTVTLRGLGEESTGDQ